MSTEPAETATSEAPRRSLLREVGRPCRLLSGGSSSGDRHVREMPKSRLIRLKHVLSLLLLRHFDNLTVEQHAWGGRFANRDHGSGNDSDPSIHTRHVLRDHDLRVMADVLDLGFEPGQLLQVRL